jgi:hypothetical protein
VLRFPAAATDFVLFKTVQTGCEANPASYSESSGRKTTGTVKLTTHLQITAEVQDERI